MAGDRVVELPCPARYDLRRTMCKPLLGPLDPSSRFASGAAWRATRSPDGPATFRVASVDGGLRVDAWGPGADWVAGHAAELTGLHDAPASFRPDHPALQELARVHAGVHLTRTLRVIEALVPTVLQQLVTWREATRALRLLVEKYGEPAPGPPGLGMLPSVETLARLPEYAYRPMGALARQARTIREVARLATKLERTATMPYDAGFALLTKVRGIGPWTAAIVLATVTGHPDAVPTGDLHLPRDVTWALARERDGSDARMLELLQPFAGHRFRVLQLIHAGNLGPPRRAPRQRIRPLP